MKRIWKLLTNKWVIVGLLVLIGLIVWFTSKAGAVDENIKTVTVSKKDLSDELTFSGVIDANEKATMRFQSSGKLVYVGVKEGDRIAKWKLLARLDTAELKKRFDRYMNTHRKSFNSFEEGEQENFEFENDASLSNDQKKTIRRTLMDNALDLGNAVIDVELSDMAIKDSYLYSPIAGVVTKVASPIAGVFVTPTQAEIAVVNPDSIYFSATADQAEVAKLKIGMKAEVTLDAFDDVDLVGVIDRIGYTPKEGETGTVYEVQIKVSSEMVGEKLRLGMTGDANFVLETKNDVVAIPSRYVKSDSGKKYVTVMENGKLSKRFIEIGEVWSGETEVLNGLSEGEKIYDKSL